MYYKIYAISLIIMLIFTLLYKQLLIKRLADKLTEFAYPISVEYSLLVFSFIPLINTLCILSFIKAQFIFMVNDLFDIN